MIASKMYIFNNEDPDHSVVPDLNLYCMQVSNMEHAVHTYVIIASFLCAFKLCPICNSILECFLIYLVCFL